MHITNGDAAIPPLRAGGVDGRILPWRDVLHDGPVPAVSWGELREVRAEFIAGMGWADPEEVRLFFLQRDGALFEALASGEEVTLWFEHDLYDQLQLTQVLAMSAWALRHGASMRLAQADDYLGHMHGDAVRALASTLRPVGEREVTAAELAWNAFTAPSPDRLRTLAEHPEALAALPWLHAAMVRLIEELPDSRTGLARSERQAVKAVAAGAATVAAAHKASHHDVESPIWLGDTTFESRISRLTLAGGPLLRDGNRLQLAADAEAILAGERGATWRTAEWWVGGTHVTLPPPPHA